MNTTDLAPIVQQVTRHERAGWDWVLLRPSLVMELIESTERLSQIAAIIDGTPPTDTTPARVGALQLWCENSREALRDALYEVRGLAKDTR